MKVFYVSLGCDKNLVDSEKMLGMLHEAHYELTDDEYDADVVIWESVERYMETFLNVNLLTQ